MMKNKVSKTHFKKKLTFCDQYDSFLKWTYALAKMWD